MSNNLLKPSDFDVFPHMSVYGSTNYECLARDIIEVLVCTGDEWRELPWDEFRRHMEIKYCQWRGMDTLNQNRRHGRFAEVVYYCSTPDMARQFSKYWDDAAANRFSYTRFIKEDK